MDVKTFVEATGAGFFTGVPDSLLKALCDYLYQSYGISGRHIIAANEGNCTALAAGYYLATGKTPLVYLQNSGIGNIINPAASLLNDRVYGIPCIFVVGWRGEPGVHDEPQHIYQGEVTVRLLEDMDIEVAILDKDSTEQELSRQMERFRGILAAGRSVAFVVRKGALTFDGKVEYKNANFLRREEAISHIVEAAGEDVIVSTTGKASRELFEIRERKGQSHRYDFLTVGSMGHASSIALGIALQKPHARIWCIDGDGAVLMHMGAMAVIASQKPRNLVHLIINNGSHETVGGQPTAMAGVDLVRTALGLGYPHAVSVDSPEALDQALLDAKACRKLTLVEIKCAIGAREDLGRPTTTAKENKNHFMEHLRELP